jgi:hypothetical protein
MIKICMLVGAVVMIGLALTAGWRAITKPSQRACASDGVHRE